MWHPRLSTEQGLPWHCYAASPLLVTSYTSKMVERDVLHLTVPGTNVLEVMAMINNFSVYTLQLVL